MVDFPEYVNEITQVSNMKSNRWALKDIWWALAFLALNFINVKIKDGIH